MYTTQKDSSWSPGVKSLKVFCDVVGRRSFSRAADENGISQSGASQMVHHLEEHLGVKLIDRSKRPFVLTPEGEAYYEGCRKLVQRYYALEEEVRTLHEEVSGKVTVASIYSVGLSHMNKIVQDFLAAYPRANVRLQYQHPHRVYELVENDQVDLGLVSYAKSSRTVKSIGWREEPMVFVCSPAHRLAQQSSVSLKDLHGLAMVSFDADLEIRHEIDRALTQARVETSVVMEFDNIETIKRAIEIDAGVSLLPRPTVEREVAAGTLVALPLSDVELVRPVGIVVRRGKELGKTARRFMQLLQAESTDATSSSTRSSEWSFAKTDLDADGDGEAAYDTDDAGLAVATATDRAAKAKA
jgi:DNA-binding transcriptional LysR family regulator